MKRASWSMLIVAMIGVATVHGAHPGDWREGFKVANAKAMTMTSWKQMYEWACAGSIKPVWGDRVATSTDLGGGRHTYINTYAAGYRDAQIGVVNEMIFIERANSGDDKRLFEIMKGFLRTQNNDEITPPGHF